MVFPAPFEWGRFPSSPLFWGVLLWVLLSILLWYGWKVNLFGQQFHVQNWKSSHKALAYCALLAQVGRGNPRFPGRRLCLALLVARTRAGGLAFPATSFGWWCCFPLLLPWEGCCFPVLSFFGWCCLDWCCNPSSFGVDENHFYIFMYFLR